MINFNEIENNLLTTAQKDDIEKIVCGAVIAYQDKILLLERSSNDYLGGMVKLPSGGKEVNESIINGLIREIQEETGLNITTKNIKSYLGSFDYKSKSGKKTRQFNFLVLISSISNLKLSTEHSNYYLINPIKNTIFNSLPISNNTREIIQKHINMT